MARRKPLLSYFPAHQRIDMSSMQDRRDPAQKQAAARARLKRFKHNLRFHE